MKVLEERRRQIDQEVERVRRVTGRYRRMILPSVLFFLYIYLFKDAGQCSFAMTGRNFLVFSAL